MTLAALSERRTPQRAMAPVTVLLQPQPSRSVARALEASPTLITTGRAQPRTIERSTLLILTETAAKAATRSDNGRGAWHIGRLPGRRRRYHHPQRRLPVCYHRLCWSHVPRRMSPPPEATCYRPHPQTASPSGHDLEATSIAGLATTYAVRPDKLAQPRAH